MKDDLAQALLGNVMGWNGPEAASDLELILALARYKYDGYQRFAPGLKFIESLALWLDQFNELHERQAAFDFVKRRLVFVSDEEMHHLVSTLYPDLVEPIIRRRSAEIDGIPEHRVRRIESSESFKRLRRQSLFLGLSDGARIDAFRRSTQNLNNEQVHSTYEVELSRRLGMREDLIDDLRESLAPGDDSFKLVFLIDDFAGSGTSLLRIEEGKFKGRLIRFANLLQEDSKSETPVFSGRETILHVCLYIATYDAMSYLRDALTKIENPPWNSPPQIHALQPLDGRSRISESTDAAFAKLLKDYYDPSLVDRHKSKGGDSVMFGYANCALPLVLHHNTPNNSVYLLWAESDKPVVPLFSRMERHR